MRSNIDISAYSAATPSRIKPEKVSLGDLPPIQKPSNMAERQKSSTLPVFHSADLEGQQSASLPNTVQNALRMKNDKKTGFRLPAELVSELEDIPYQVKNAYQKRIDKTDILVAALAYYINDFHQLGKDSLLYKHFIGGER